MTREEEDSTHLDTPASETGFPVGFEIPLQLGTITDYDARTDSAGTTYHNDLDQLRITWTASAGSFKDEIDTGTSVVWIAPQTAQNDITIAANIADRPHGPERERYTARQESFELDYEITLSTIGIGDIGLADINLVGFEPGLEDGTLEEVPEEEEEAPGVFVVDGQTVLVVEDPGVAGLSLELHFDSTKVSLGGITESPILVTTFPAWFTVAIVEEDPIITVAAVSAAAPPAGDGDNPYGLDLEKLMSEVTLKVPGTEDKYDKLKLVKGVRVLCPLNLPLRRRFSYVYSSKADEELHVQFRLECSATSHPNIPVNIGGVPGSEEFAWKNGGVGGLAEPQSHNSPFFVETAIFTGLPPDNGSFGPLDFTISIPGAGAFGDHVRIFFDGCKNDHPDPGKGVTPNWFFYWRQFVPSMDKFVFDGKIPAFGSYAPGAHGNPDDDVLTLGSNACAVSLQIDAIWHDEDGRKAHPSHKVGATAGGIDCCAITVAHEMGHKRTHDRVHIAGKPDSDGDGVCDDDELEYGTDAYGNVLDSWQMWRINAAYADNGDDEYIARRAEQEVTEEQLEALRRQDWSSYLPRPGMAPAKGKQYDTYEEF